MLTLLTAAVLALQPPAPETQVSKERLMATLAALPVSRAARGDAASQQGLAATEDLIVAKLKELGYEPQLEPLSWNLSRQAQQDDLHQKQERMEKIMEKKRAKPPAEGQQPPAPSDSKPADKPQPPKPPPAPTGPKLPDSTPELAGRTWHNIIVELPGTELPKEVLIVSAHFDAVPGAPGADDDGSGVAALLEAARVLKDQKLRRTVRLIFFNLEEIGLEGSKEHVKRYKLRVDAGLEKPIGMVSLEMLGFFSTAPDSQRSPMPKIEGVFDPPTVGDFIGIATLKKHSAFARRWAAGMQNAPPLPDGSALKVVVADMLPIAPPDFLRSDHAYFLASGYPALMLTDTANFRNPNYHKPTDTVATIDADRFTQVARGVVSAIRTLADAPTAKDPAPASTEPRP